jgi:hypothetical protein
LLLSEVLLPLLVLLLSMMLPVLLLFALVCQQQKEG